MVNPSHLKNLVNRLPKARVLVIGDLILDEFIWGDVERISPEAPVPVVWVKSESFMPGGASNVASNLRALGATPFLCGIVGKDERGKLLQQELQKRGIDTGGLILDGERPTTMKTRIVAHHQQVVRVDREKTSEINGNILEQILAYIRKQMEKIDALLIEDYGKGVISARLIQEVVSMAKANKKIISVDPKENHFDYYQGVTVITPNHHEAGNAVGIKVNGDESLHRVGKELLKLLKCDSVLITVGENGMCLFETKGKVTDIPTVAQEVFDVSGAGDTVIAVLTAALSVGATVEQAARISNFAAGIVVGKIGVAVATPDELIERIGRKP